MNWLTLCVANATWIVCLLLMRRRYRKLLAEAIGMLDETYRALTPYVGKEGALRERLGRPLSDLCVDAGIFPRKGKADA
jgi:hypothetical protein